MGRAVSVSIQKGGVGKTTISINLADRLSDRDQSTLLIDLDPQGHATEGCGLAEAYDRGEGLDQLLIDNDQDSLDDLIVEGPGFDVLPAHQNLDQLENKLQDETLGILRLRRRVVEPLLGKDYEYIVLDTPPSLGLLSDSGLVAAEHTMIPIETREASVRGLEQMITKQIRPIREELDLEILAIVPNRLSGDNEDKRIIEQLEENFPEFLPDFARSDVDSPGPGIRKRIALSRAWREGIPLSQWDPGNDMIPRFDELADIVEQGGINRG